MTKPARISVIGGGGMVGAATAYALMIKNVPAEILIVDVVEKAALGQALDIADASFDRHASCRVGTFKEAGQSDLVIITAGLPQKPGEPRSELLGKNAAIIRTICNDMQPIRKDMKIMVVANPVDTLTHLAHKFSGLPRNQVFGSGTFLDSNRLRCELAQIASVHPSSINAYVLGEHGDRQFVGWSAATIGGQRLIEHPKFRGADLEKIRKTVADKAYAIIDAKRSTYFGIGMNAATIAEAMLSDDHVVFPLVNYVEKYGVFMSWPCSLGREGVEQIFDIQLNDSEIKSLNIAVSAIKEMAAEADSAK